jgi:hypothetical protein
MCYLSMYCSSDYLLQENRMVAMEPVFVLTPGWVQPKAIYIDRIGLRSRDLRFISSINKYFSKLLYHISY